MHDFSYKDVVYGVSLFLLATVSGLWSWNTLADLFSWPLAQYRHAIAAFLLLLILKWVLTANHRAISRVFGSYYEHPDH